MEYFPEERPRVKANKHAVRRRFFAAALALAAGVMILGIATEVFSDDLGKSDAAPPCFEVGGIKYSYVTDKNGNDVMIRSTVYTGTDLTIPDTITYGDKEYNVVEISNGAFEGNEHIENLVIGEKVTKIGYKAFYKCKYLDNRNTEYKLTIPDSVTYIGDVAFERDYFKHLKIGVGLKEMGANPFSRFVKLETITLDNKNMNYAVYDNMLFTADMSKLITVNLARTDNIYLPDTVKEIGHYVGYNYNRIAVSMPGVVTFNALSIGGVGCYYAPKLKEIKYDGLFHSCAIQTIPTNAVFKSRVVNTQHDGSIVFEDYSSVTFGSKKPFINNVESIPNISLTNAAYKTSSNPVVDMGFDASTWVSIGNEGTLKSLTIVSALSDNGGITIAPGPDGAILHIVNSANVTLSGSGDAAEGNSWYVSDGSKWVKDTVTKYAELPKVRNHLYDGNVFSGVVAGDENSIVTAGSGETSASASAVGKYTVNVKLNGDSGYKWVDGTGKSKTFMWMIAPMSPTPGDPGWSSSPAAPPSEYTGTAIARPTISNPNYKLLDSGSNLKDAGDHCVVAVQITAEANKTKDVQVWKRTITKIPLTVTADNQNVTYGADAPEYTLSLTSGTIKNSQTLADLGITASSVYTKSSAVGSDPAITVNVPVLKNYTVTTVNGKVSIGKADLNVRVSDKTITYGSTPTYGIELLSGSGIKNNELVSKAVTSVTYSCDYNIGDASKRDVKSYTISASAHTSNNYNVTFTNGTLTVSKKNIGVKAADETVAYGATVPAYKLELASGSVLAFNDTLANSITGITYSGYVAGNDVGLYDIIAASGTSANYNLTYSKGTLTVIGAPVSVPIAKTGLIYDGSLQDGVASDAKYTLGGTYSATNVGSYSATVTPNAGYAWDGLTDTSVKTIAWSIAPVPVYNPIMLAWVGGPAFTYDGSLKSVYVSGIPDGVSVSYSGNTGANVGKYTASASFTGMDGLYISSYSWEIVRDTTIVSDNAIFAIERVEVGKGPVYSGKVTSDPTYDVKNITIRYYADQECTILVDDISNANPGTYWAISHITGLTNYPDMMSNLFGFAIHQADVKFDEDWSVKGFTILGMAIIAICASLYFVYNRLRN